MATIIGRISVETIMTREAEHERALSRMVEARRLSAKRRPFEVTRQRKEMQQKRETRRVMSGRFNSIKL